MRIAAALLVAWLAWRSPARRMRRRRARVTRLVAADYRIQRRAPATGERPVTVAELVERAATEQRAKQVRRPPVR